MVGALATGSRKAYRRFLPMMLPKIGATHILTSGRNWMAQYAGEVAADLGLPRDHFSDGFDRKKGTPVVAWEIAHQGCAELAMAWWPSAMQCELLEHLKRYGVRVIGVTAKDMVWKPL